jgi:hypothetical protein
MSCQWHWGTKNKFFGAKIASQGRRGRVLSALHFMELIKQLAMVASEKLAVLLHVISLTTRAKACSIQSKSIKQQCMGYGNLVACP